MKADLSQLYSELDLPPECSLEDFRRAYLRRITELHPDRTGRAPATPEAQAALQQLVSTYTEVTSFHRRYGRMPGAAPRSGTHRGPGMSGSSGSPTMTHPALHSASRETSDNEHGGQEQSRIILRLIVIILTMAVLMAIWDLTHV